MTPLSPIVRLVVAAAAVALATWLTGWWAVAAVAFVAGALPSRLRLGGGSMAIAGAAGWGALLVAHTLNPSFGTLLSRAGAVFHVPGVVLLLVTLLYAALLAWSGAVVGLAVRRALRPEREIVAAAPAHLATPRYDSADVPPRASIVEPGVR